MSRFPALLARDLPVLVGSVDDSFADGYGDAVAAAGLDVAELRVDRFADATPAGVDRAIARLGAGIPTLATIRAGFEGGAWTGDEAARLALFRHLCGRVDAIDVELAAGAIVGDVLAAARAAGTTTIVSHHDFAATPGDAALQATLDAALALRPDVVKISAMAHGAADLRRLAAFLLANAAQPLVVIAMGPAGLPSRVAFPFLGSRLTYCDLGMGNAPGQLAFAQALALLRSLSPAYDALKTGTRPLP